MTAKTQSHLDQLTKENQNRTLISTDDLKWGLQWENNDTKKEIQLEKIKARMGFKKLKNKWQRSEEEVMQNNLALAEQKVMNQLETISLDEAVV